MRCCAWIRFCANYAKYSWNPFTHVVPTDINRYRVRIDSTCRVVYVRRRTAKYEMIDEHRMMLLADKQGIYLSSLRFCSKLLLLFICLLQHSKKIVYSADAVQRIPAGLILRTFLQWTIYKDEIVHFFLLQFWISTARSREEIFSICENLNRYVSPWFSVWYWRLRERDLVFSHNT